DLNHVIASEFVVNNSGDAARDMAITLIDTNRAPVLANAIPNQSAMEESLFSYTLPANTFSDPDGEALTYSAALANGNPLPSWLAFNASTRTFSGMPNDSDVGRSEEHTSELQSRENLVCGLLRDKNRLFPTSASSG